LLYCHGVRRGIEKESERERERERAFKFILCFRVLEGYFGALNSASTTTTTVFELRSSSLQFKSFNYVPILFNLILFFLFLFSIL
jgi:hypothetical protein